MTFFSIIFRGLLRRPVRTALTMMGIAIGIGAVVMLVGLSSGFEKSWSDGFDAHKTDVVVGNLSGGILPKSFSEEVGERIKGFPYVAETTVLLSELMGVEELSMIMVSGREWGGFAWNNLELIEGSLPENETDNSAVLGKYAAESLKKKIGDTVQIEATEFKVTGIVDGGAVVENGTIFVALPRLQEATINEGLINFVNIRLEPGTTEEQTKELQAKIEKEFPEVKAMLAEEVLSSSQGVQAVRAMSWSTSLLAVIIGVLGVMNTMLMTVFERKHEIGVLLALGWKRRRIVKMVLYESALLGILGGIAGVLLGVVALMIVGQIPGVQGLLDPQISGGLILVSLVISLIVGVVSGIYPALRSSRLSPSVALQG